MTIDIFDAESIVYAIGRIQSTLSDKTRKNIEIVPIITSYDIVKTLIEIDTILRNLEIKCH